MCELVDISMEGRCIKVADIKKAYIENIMKCAPLCDAIDKVVLFGSALESRCTDSSDVDIAIFGKYPKSKMYRLKSYHDFVEAVVSYGRLQDYDLLYYSAEETDPGWQRQMILQYYRISKMGRFFMKGCDVAGFDNGIDKS